MTITLCKENVINKDFLYKTTEIKLKTRHSPDNNNIGEVISNEYNCTKSNRKPSKILFKWFIRLCLLSIRCLKYIN